MKEFSIPVTWLVWDEIEVETESIEDAVRYAKEHIDEIQPIILSQGFEGEYNLMTLEEFKKEIRDIAKIDSEYHAFIQNFQLTDCKDSLFKFICTQEQRAIYKLDIDNYYKYHGITYQKLIVDTKNIDLENKLENMYGSEIDDKVYNLINKNKKTLYPEIERYVSQNLYKYLNFINEETLRLLEEDLIDEYDWTDGLYNCDELYLRAIIYVLRKECR